MANWPQVLMRGEPKRRFSGAVSVIAFGMGRFLQTWEQAERLEVLSSMPFGAVAAAQAVGYDPKMKIRRAVVGDAAEACTVLRRSIAELCFSDHGNDPSVLARWLSNKTPENVASWAVQTDHSLLVAVEDGKILAVGAVTDTGKITLNYVSPDARFRGVSKTLLRALEVRAAERGNVRCTLESSETARRFYLAAGYRETGSAVIMFGTPSYPMSRHLPPPQEGSSS